jgi:hypothetical protein
MPVIFYSTKPGQLECVPVGYIQPKQLAEANATLAFCAEVKQASGVEVKQQVAELEEKLRTELASESRLNEAALRQQTAETLLALQTRLENYFVSQERLLRETSQSFLCDEAAATLLAEGLLSAHRSKMEPPLTQWSCSSELRLPVLTYASAVLTDEQMQALDKLYEPMDDSTASATLSFSRSGQDYLYTIESLVSRFLRDLQPETSDESK